MMEDLLSIRETKEELLNEWKVFEDGIDDKDLKNPNEELEKIILANRSNFAYLNILGRIQDRIKWLGDDMESLGKFVYDEFKYLKEDEILYSVDDLIKLYDKEIDKLKDRLIMEPDIDTVREIHDKLARYTAISTYMREYKHLKNLVAFMRNIDLVKMAERSYMGNGPGRACVHLKEIDYGVHQCELSRDYIDGSNCSICRKCKDYLGVR